MIDLRPQQVEHTARGSRAANPAPLLVDTTPIAKARPPAQATAQEGQQIPYSMELLMEDYEQHFATGECPWHDSHGVPSLVELVNHFCDCRQEDYDWAQVLALALLARLTGSAYE